MATEQVGFKTSMFGFRKVDVLAYIDTMSAEHLSEQQKEQARAAALEETVATLTDEKNALVVALSEKKEQVALLHQALESQTEIATVAQQKADDLTEALKKAEASAHDYQGRLFAREGEATVLRRDNANLTRALTEKQQEIERVFAQTEAVQKEAAAQIEQVQESAQVEIAQANQRVQAENLVMQRKMNASAGDMVQEVAVLKQAIATLECHIADSLSDLQRSTQMLKQTLGATEENMQALGVKLEAFPDMVQCDAKKGCDGIKTAEAAALAQSSCGKSTVKKSPYVTSRRMTPTPTISSLLLAKIAKMIGET